MSLLQTKQMNKLAPQQRDTNCCCSYCFLRDTVLKLVIDLRKIMTMSLILLPEQAAFISRHF